ncbi:MAG: PAQR family membrane homeostasis protein TrhA [Gaiellaceae bacterium]
MAEKVKPRLRGVFHEWAFFLAIPLGIALVLVTETTRGRIAAGVFALSVVTMFGASALYHIPDWTPKRRAWLRRLDHAGIYCLIAGTYTPVGLLALDGAWRTVVLAIVWSGCAAAIFIRLFWVSAPKWLSAVVAIALGWVGIVAMPEIYFHVGLACLLLILGGGILYSVGAAIYATRRPDPWPAVFGYHEIFHALIVVAVGLQFAAIAFYVVPT